MCTHFGENGEREDPEAKLCLWFGSVLLYHTYTHTARTRGRTHTQRRSFPLAYVAALPLKGSISAARTAAALLNSTAFESGGTAMFCDTTKDDTHTYCM